MKKGFTMIELIFVIVILGILASVAVPRLAGTKADAEISATVANLRTLVSDANVYYGAKGSFGQAKWNEITNVPLGSAGVVAAEAAAFIKVANQNCISIQMVEGNGARPAYILFTKDNENINNTVCTQVQNSAPLQAYFSSRVEGVNTTAIQGAMAIGSSIKLVR